jgi:hypothetical protein
MPRHPWANCSSFAHNTLLSNDRTCRENKREKVRKKKRKKDAEKKKGTAMDGAFKIKGEVAT